MLQIVPKNNPGALAALDDIFSDDSDKPATPAPKKKKSVKSLGDITNEVTSLCAALKNISKQPEFEDVILIPENETTPEINKFMSEFVKSHNPSLFSSLDFSKYSKNIQLQVELLHSTIDPKIVFNEIPDDIDPRISSLIHWKISQNEVKNVRCYHLLHCLLNFVKTPIPAPISVFFLEFNIQNLIFQFCQILSKLFNESPFLSPVLESFSSFVSDPSSIKSLIIDDTEKNNFFNTNANSNSDGNNNSMDEDSEDSDDDFGDLRPMGPSETAPPLIKVKSISFDNPLENLDDKNEEPIKIPEGPSPVTFKFFRNKPKATPEEFTRWMIKHQSVSKNIFSYKEDSQGVNSSKKISEEIILDLMNQMFDTDIRPMIPKRIKSKYLPIMLPIYHQINSTSKELFTTGCDINTILENEFLAQTGLAMKNQKMIDTALSFFYLEVKARSKPIPIVPLTERRPYPQKEIEIDKETIFLLKLIDYSLIHESHSPISLLPSSLPPQSSDLSKQFLAESLFNVYSKKSYPPYISFRAAFTIGLLISDQNPSLAIDFIYEGIFLVMHFYPQLNYSTPIQSAYFLMGELFNNINKYYLCCMSFDNAINLCQINHYLSAKAASIAMKNMDAVRAVFHYLSTIKQFISANQKEEYLYTTQMVVSIYVEHDLTTEAIQLISYIIKVHDKLDSINSVNAVSTLCKLYCSKCHFEDATILANSIDSSSNQSMARITDSIKAQIFIAQNRFKDFYNAIRPALSFPNNKLPPQLVVKEIVLPTIKTLARAHVSRDDFISALFWSEIGCHISSQSASKDTPKFFLLRGRIMYYIYYSMYDNHIILKNSHLDKYAQSFGKYPNDLKLLKTEISKEALASIAVSINQYERYGNVAKLLESRMLYLQLVCSHLLQEQPENFTLTKASLYSTCNSAKVNPRTLNLENCEINGPDQFVQFCRSVQNIANSYYDPFSISIAKLLTGVIFLLKNEIETAEMAFDQSLSIMRQFFFRGTKFIVANCKIWFTFKLTYLLRFMLSFLMYFSDEFIHNHLFLFDMMNDVSLLLSYQKNTILTQTKSSIEPKIEFTSSILTALEEPKWPKFNAIPLQNEKKRVSISQKIFSLYERIRKNEFILSDQRITTANKRLICKIIGFKKKQSIPEFSIPANSVYVFLGNGEIGVYIPSIATKRMVSLAALKKPSFIEGVKNMINWSLELCPFSEDFLKACILIGKTLFGKLDFFKQFTIPEVADDHDLGIDGNYNQGKLYSIVPPQSGMIVIIDHLLNFLPFEFFFPTISLIRRINSEERVNHKYSLRPVLFRNKFDQNFVDFRKKKLLEILTDPLPNPIIVDESEGTIVFPFPVFDPSKPTIKYVQLYSFFDVIPIYANSLPNLTEMKNALFVFTFSDLVAMPDFLFQLIDSIPKACFIFVPANHVSLALSEMKKILERHQIRKYFIDKNERDENAQMFSLLFKDKYAFMTTLQMTLMKKLRIPVAIISPNRSVF
ncbi:hypothetical protein TRFO_24998 [Tritrichomonas foetus]|uniref:Uncharacterized protein n=1 Tax=Tritrichomonas foetus TaxID=1144522 RepID=A0A1J4KBN9_9EUKA|nr:hypothetical protein TRFO_24998 [Tritrichomonas foetus]|eukprot:OHT06893.1 hypothetical protein TRFO_24998 [Tritrichomonas foetus]